MFHCHKVVCVEICLGNLHKIGCNFVKVSGQLSSSVMDCPGGEEVLCGPLKDTDEKWLRGRGNLLKLLQSSNKHEMNSSSV